MDGQEGSEHLLSWLSPKHVMLQIIFFRICNFFITNSLSDTLNFILSVASFVSGTPAASTNLRKTGNSKRKGFGLGFESRYVKYHQEGNQHAVVDVGWTHFDRE